MAKQQSHKSSACKLQTNSELKASITQQTENQKAREDDLIDLLIGNLNITSICSKFNQTKCLLKGKDDILTITESKLDNSFRTTHFLIDSYSKPFRFDRNRNAVGVLLNVREDSLQGIKE